jgi:ATP-NAD kinase N-terminal domain
MLGALRAGAPHGVPILGVNLGRLGYLTEVDAAHLDAALSALSNGEYTIEPRTGLALVPRDDAPTQIAYNDVASPACRAGVKPRSPSASTASCSCGTPAPGLSPRHPRVDLVRVRGRGPLVSPSAQRMIVMPDAPHGLFNRAVVPADGSGSGSRSCQRAPPSQSRATLSSSDTPIQEQCSTSSRARMPRDHTSSVHALGMDSGGSADHRQCSLVAAGCSRLDASGDSLGWRRLRSVDRRLALGRTHDPENHRTRSDKSCLNDWRCLVVLELLGGLDHDNERCRTGPWLSQHALNLIGLPH